MILWARKLKTKKENEEGDEGEARGKKGIQANIWPACVSSLVLNKNVFTAVIKIWDPTPCNLVDR